MKKTIGILAVSGVLIASYATTTVSADNFGVMETNYSKIVVFEDTSGNFLASKVVSAKQGSTVTLNLPSLQGYVKPVESVEIKFDNKDSVHYTYLSENENGGGDLQLPDISLPPISGILPETPLPITPVKPPVNSKASFKIYSELQDWEGNVLISEFNPTVIEGTIGDKVEFSIPSLPKGYVLSESPDKTIFHFGEDQEAKYVFKLRYMDISQQLVRRINFVDDSGQQLSKERVDGYTFRGSQDYSTGQYIWENKSVTLGDVEAPEIPGYIAVEKVIPGDTYKVISDTLETQVHEFTVHYTKNKGV
ncbi:hypothetical protein EFE32_13415 [Lactococcus lactis subsp. lactis]|uniref:mucin-binding protein n=1 Tax=Lactococcus lactis TaxID=1358 RepID=UPI00223BC325|nr:MucBP domain-containing protein [Lactococcus lactis]MCT0017763.1 hypothetical protein [Lactococcus lactis subsp. lactis]